MFYVRLFPLFPQIVEHTVLLIATETQMGLIQDLQNDILDPKTSLSTILRRAKVLAVTLGNDELKLWVDNELNGYDSRKEIPDYRCFLGQNLGDFSGAFGSGMTNAPIPLAVLPEIVQEYVKELHVSQGVRALESLLESDEKYFRLPWPADMVAYVQEEIYNKYVCVSAWRVLGREQVEQVLDTVRNRLLNFILELKEKYPEINKSENAIPKIPEKEISSVFHTHIYGDQNVVATGSDIVQEVSQNELHNDIDALISFMREEVGVPADDAAKLKKAIKDDGQREEPNKFGPKVANWVAKMTKKSLNGTWEVVAGTAQAMIIKTLCKYYGWG
jgi:hypothetical protein